MYSGSLVASNDSRFNFEIHFILSDIDKKFLFKNNIENISVEKFKNFVRSQEPEFKALAGSLRVNIKRVNVYNIEKIKESLRRENDYTSKKNES